MARRVGFNEPKDAGPPEIGAGVAQVMEKAAGRPAVRRNWTRIVIQIFWVDVWIIAAFTISRDMFHSLLSDGGAVTLDQLLLLSIAFLGALVAARKMIRLLRGEPVAGAS